MAKQLLSKVFLCSALALAGGNVQAQIQFTKTSDVLSGLQNGEGSGTPIVADFNNDGRMDIFSSGQTYEYSSENDRWDWGDNYYLLLSNEDGSFTAVDRNSNTGLSIFYDGQGSRALDINQDGLIDFFFFNSGRGWGKAAPSGMYFAINNGDGTFTTTKFEDGINVNFNNNKINEGNGYRATSVADIDKDGYPDILMQYYDNERGRRVVVLKNNKGEGWTVKEINNLQSHGSAAFIDIDNNGYPDIVSIGYTNEKGHQIYFYRNLGNGEYEFAAEMEEKASKWGFDEDAVINLIDYDQDGKMDILCVGGISNADIQTHNDGCGKTAIFLHNTTTDHQSFSFEEVASEVTPQSGTSPRSFAMLADFDGDGWADYLSRGWHNGDWDILFSSNLKNTQKVESDFRQDEGNTTFGDVNNDGLIDVLVNHKECNINASNATVLKPTIPENIEAVYNADNKTLTVTWEAGSMESGSKPFYNLYLKNKKTDKTFMIAPANAETGFQLAYTEFNGYVLGTSYTFENVEPSNYEIGVQSVTYSWQASAFAVINVADPTAIANVEGAEKTVDVYTTAGVCVKSGVKESEALNGLNKGIYVVNGKKVIK